jgi:hypothetical protein
MNPPDNPDAQQSEEQQLFDQLVEWVKSSTDPKCQAISLQPEDRDRIVNAIKEIASIPIAQAEEGARVQFVVKNKYVFNLRPMVVPAVVAILVKATVIVVPGLDSALLPVLDALNFAEKARDVYKKLTDDEVDVFGAVSDLYTAGEICHSVTNPYAHPTADGVKHWFAQKRYQAPQDIDGILRSLIQKGALIGHQLAEGQTLYAPTFLGKEKKHE